MTMAIWTLSLVVKFSFGSIQTSVTHTDGLCTGRLWTSLSGNGARHDAKGPRLGSLRDSESDGSPSFAADV